MSNWREYLTAAERIVINQYDALAARMEDLKGKRQVIRTRALMRSYRKKKKETQK